MLIRGKNISFTFKENYTYVSIILSEKKNLLTYLVAYNIKIANVDIRLVISIIEAWRIC